MHAVRRGLTSLAHTTAALLTQAATSSGVQLLPTSLQTRLVTSTLQMSTKLARDWKPPENGESRGTAQLTLYNSLVDDKVPFVPIAGAGSKEISWYTCGPTVYDAAHMGHARNYVTFDIVRRILEDYFGYNCLFVMNVTDVDDKIILRARRNFLLAQYRAENTDAATVLAYAIAAVEAAANKQTAKVAEAEALLATAKSADKKDTRCQKDLAVAIENEKHKLKQVQEEALAKLKALPQTASVDDVLSVSSDYIAEVLDREKGAAVTDSSIFRAHAARYEREFREDMVALGCREPTITTRVSEYIPQVVTYVEKIIANGMAYAAGGSVYFDTVKFRGCGHTYGKLKPWAVGSALLAAEGESNFETSEKRCPMDFALWKASKPGEPVWDSPWGPGRPGWHIECSAMASAVFGERMDLHSGGEDLRFPHHDNELAQAEAHYHTEGCTQWVNYFLHSGHLEINGLKMSKSLKNFITIKEALQISTARQLRLMFALQQWNKPMIYSDQSMREVETKEAQLRKFFQNVETAIREAGDITDSLTTYEAPEEELFKALKVGKASVHESLSDNINTPGAMAALADLIKATNIYLDKRQDTKSRRPELLHAVSSYVTRILSVMGLVEPPADRPGFGDASTSGAGDVLVPVLDKFAAFRDEIRALCKSKAEPRELLAACDRLRDETMVELGVRLEDKPDGTATWKRDDPAAMRAEQAERTRLAAEAAATKLRAQLAKKEDEAKKLAAQAALPPVEEALAHKYSVWDAATGEPTHDKEGKELDEKAKSKAQKDVKDVRKKREGLNKRLAEDPNYLTKLDQEIETLRQQLQGLEVTAANPAQ